VKIPDVNLLIYAADTEAPKHRPARRWLEKLLGGEDTVAFPWVVLLAFVRLTSNPAVFREPFTVHEALRIVDGWLRQPNTLTVDPTDRHLPVLTDLLAEAGTGGNLVTDAHLAALTIEHAAELLTSDHGFSRFPGLRWSDPLVDG
jgi:toxin-antitoxin system PIN domain toxin